MTTIFTQNENLGPFCLSQKKTWNVIYQFMNELQARRKVWNTGGAGNTVVGIICPPVFKKEWHDL